MRTTHQQRHAWKWRATCGCLGDHGTTDCPRKVPDPEVPPSCVLCKQDGHPANYRGCPRAPRKRRPRETTARATSQKSKPSPKTTAEASPAPQEAPKPQQVISKAPPPPTHNKAPQAASVAPKANAWNKPLPYVKAIPTQSVVEPTPIREEVKRMKVYLAEVRFQLDRMAAVLESFDI
ncbi:protein TonB-like [Melitaea cinxia]|uniref:protein TonB-like n=1 Tax=Melitaea cinxia TaxID=113334 RepID=UPI001E2728FC|nr:protein TonB-like [Melitaea cinxia]